MQNDELWTHQMLLRHYWKRPHLDVSLLEALREDRWRRSREQLAKEVEQLMPTVLKPPAQLREIDPEKNTIEDVARTVKVHHEQR